MRRHCAWLAAFFLLPLIFFGCAGGSRGQYIETASYPDFSRHYDKVKESLVWIRVVRPAVDKRGKRIPADERQSSGSGVIISSGPAPAGGYESYISTNNHVTSSAEKITVYLFPGDEFYKAELVGFDDLYDFSLLRIRTPHGLKAAVLGDASKLKVGNWVYAVGNPHDHTWSLSVGFIGNLWKDPLLETIQFDGAFNPGNSGGGLFNVQGELIGVPVRIEEGGTIGFALSVNLLKRALPALNKGGRVPYGFLGVTLKDTEDMDEEAAEKIFPSSLPRQGVFVDEVHKGLPADMGGMFAGDIILAVNGKHVFSPRHLQKIVADSMIGEAIPIRVIRDGREMTLFVSPAERPEE